MRIGRRVTLKLLPQELLTDGGRLAPFESEARTLASLNYPNILVLHETGIFDRSPYLVSELLEGETLRKFIAGGRLPVRKAVEYGIQLAEGLAAVHSRAIVHRDLKPENIFITRADRVKILDFGLVKTTANGSSEADARTIIQKTDPETVLRTIGYMSPEHVRAEQIDHRLDRFPSG